MKFIIQHQNDAALRHSSEYTIDLDKLFSNVPFSFTFIPLNILISSQCVCAVRVAHFDENLQILCALRIAIHKINLPEPTFLVSKCLMNTKLPAGRI